ncbi:MAG TPA: major capsid protein, partial [Vicinamibacterales bacterium]|nr:major capsid protein [Vicinamibacterales bacterium]
ALVAAGGICAPSTPFYGQVNFATEAEPVWDSLPVFRAARGGVNVSESTYIADITSAISSISEADDALGGTFATKSCQDLTCPEFTETFVQILAHCREYGNLNARTWPEKIAHENALTMAALARTTEDFMLERIKALSINVTNGVETLGALIYLVDAIVKAKWGISTRFRMPANARFRALLPAYTLDLLLLDTVQTQFDRYRSRGDIDAYLRSVGIDPIYYIDGNFAAGDDQVADAAQTAAAIDGFPNTIQWAIFPDGAFLGIDAGSLELGIVRDSTLNSTNDFQVFGERFRNLVRLAPAQSAYWVTTDWCPTGQFPPDGTARTCE